MEAQGFCPGSVVVEEPMATLPLLLFPKPTSVTRSDLPTVNASRPVFPNPQRQGQRLGPKFETLIRTFDSGRLQAHRHAQGEDPDLVLVLETAGALDDFIHLPTGSLDWSGFSAASLRISSRTKIFSILKSWTKRSRASSFF